MYVVCLYPNKRKKEQGEKRMCAWEKEKSEKTKEKEKKKVTDYMILLPMAMNRNKDINRWCWLHALSF